MLTCPDCGASRGLHTTTVYTVFSGERRRLRICTHCGAKVRTLQAPGQPERLAQELLPCKPRRRSCKLTAEQVVEIRYAIASGKRAQGLAAQYGVSRQAIDQIAAGQTWPFAGGPLRKPRQSRPVAIDGGPQCEGCDQWCGGCSFDFPEAGGVFAAECGLYEPRSQATSAA